MAPWVKRTTKEYKKDLLKRRFSPSEPIGVLIVGLIGIVIISLLLIASLFILPTLSLEPPNSMSLRSMTVHCRCTERIKGSQDGYVESG